MEIDAVMNKKSIEFMNSADKNDLDMAANVRHMIIEITGKNLTPDNVDTPVRVVKSYKEIYSGYGQKIEDILTIFGNTEMIQDIILLKDIEMYSMCEHHLLPFFGKAHVAYIPNNQIVGISKLARIVDMYSHRMQIQERIGKQVVDALMQHLDPLGAACVIEATHMCMRMRGVAKQNSTMVTSSVAGAFENDSSAKEELMRQIYG
jgi:GTP cyclohydrolase I